MLATSFKFKGHECFKNEWSGFDDFKPINVIIGRNNTGKSQLLDMLERLTETDMRALHLPSLCGSTLDEEFLRKVFPNEGWSPGALRWKGHSSHLVGKPVKWKRKSRDTNVEVVSLENLGDSEDRNAERRKQIARHLESVTTPLQGKTFFRLLADRDIQPEATRFSFDLGPDGRGATNLIRRCTLAKNRENTERLIREHLLRALCRVLGNDASFTRIKVEQDETSEHQHWEVLFEEPQKGLIPLSRSGSGLKTVILVLLNLLVLPTTSRVERRDCIFAFEELENNLHPALLRRLFHFLTDYVKREECMLFLSTHSNVALDFFGPHEDAQIIRVTHDGESASTKTIAAHFDQVELLSELGARPSDLLQANGVIWLEGPSDRIYFNRFIELFSDGELREGRDYQCAFYGGSNLANTTFSAPEESDGTFANLLRLNHNIAVVCDGDRTAASGEGSGLKRQVVRIKKEVKSIVPRPYLWITEAKEIENYIPGSVWAQVYKKENVPDPAKYDRFPRTGLDPTEFFVKHLDRKSFDKCEFAMKAVGHLKREALSGRFEMEKQMTALVERIRSWNE